MYTNLIIRHLLSDSLGTLHVCSSQKIQSNNSGMKTLFKMFSNMREHVHHNTCIITEQLQKSYIHKSTLKIIRICVHIILHLLNFRLIQ